MAELKSNITKKSAFIEKFGKSSYKIEDLVGDERFERYYNLLCDWNSRFNLTALTSREDVFVKHFLDSVLPADLFPDGASILDVGSGAGFPGVCLKIVRPDLNITLLDSVGKKIAFLEALITELNLAKTLNRVNGNESSPQDAPSENNRNLTPDSAEISDICPDSGKKAAENTKNSKTNAFDNDFDRDFGSGIRAVKSRIEDFPVRNFDVATARAVAPLSVLCEYCLPFLRKGGIAIFYKSADCEEEISAAASALSTLGGKISFVDKRQLCDGVLRSFVVVEKVAPCPSRFPRGGNKPRLSPL